MRIIVAGLVLSCLFNCDVLARQVGSSRNGFVVKRGTNVSHWLSQSGRRGEQRRDWFTDRDVAYLASLGFDHLRIPVDEEQLWDEEGNAEPEAFGLLHNGIRWCLDHGLRVIVDLHILRSHHFIAEERPLWTDPAEQDKFVGLWRELSAELSRYPIDSLAYELMNEAVADDPEDWNRLLARAHEAIRTLEPGRTIVVGSNRWQNVRTFDVLRVPPDDPNILLSFHFYIPMLLTHYRTSWNDLGVYEGPVSYPGRLVDDVDLAKLDGETAAIVRRNDGVYDRDSLAALVDLPLQVASRLGLPLYCGEWGVYHAAPEGPKLRWYEDMRAIMEANNIGWATWDYKGGFGLIDRSGQPFEALIDVLLNDGAADR